MSCMAGPNGDEKSRSVLMASSSGGIGYCYPDVITSSSGSQNIHHQTHLLSQLQSSFDPNTDQMYNLTSGMDQMIGFSSKNNLISHHDHHNHENSSSSVLWKEYQSGGPNNSSSKAITPTEFYQHGFNKLHHDHLISDTTTNGSLIISPQDHSSSSAWNQHHNRLLHVDDQSNLMKSCAFTCEGNERPSQGLSLSLNSSNPSTIGLQSFELINHDDDLRFGPSSSRSVNIQSQMQGGIINFQIRNSKYLCPAQELLSEFCNLGIDDQISKIKGLKNTTLQDENNAMMIKSTQSLYSLDLLELQRRKTKLLHMLEEVDRRYKHYCHQMKTVCSSFESVAGNGSATAYSALASRAMSRHFRCLKDSILSQIKATKKAIVDKDSSSGGNVITGGAGTSKGETPRLRVLDQTLRQQRVFQQMSMMESHPWRPQRGLPERSVSVLRAWLFEHFLHPYPSDVDKHILARQTGLSRSQVSNWFINARVRLWKPMVEEMYLEELKDDHEINIDHHDIVSPNSTNEDQKPTHDQLIRMDNNSDCLSSVVLRNNGGGAAAMELDFSSYGGGSIDYGGGGSGGGGGVSLTLGLHQQGSSLNFYNGRSEQIMGADDDHVNQYSSLLDSETHEETNLPYRNLMGAQLLHDLAG